MLYQLSYAHHITFACTERHMAHPAGLEPATIRLEGGCSIQLSYGRFMWRQPLLSRPSETTESVGTASFVFQAVLGKRGACYR